MINFKIIVGANYGDEGKGLATNYFSTQTNNNNNIVVLFNGGAQRGHTVDKTEYFLHVFHHFGSGTFNMCPTYYDADFILNPMIWCGELQTLQNYRFGMENISLYVNSQCRVSTPTDMFINQISEILRCKNKHGSCGIGIWETTVRYKDSIYNLPYCELIKLTTSELKNYLSEIRDTYLWYRLNEIFPGFTIKNIPEDYIALLLDYELSDNIILRYIDDFNNFKQNTIMVDSISGINNFSKKNENVQFIFEGGQGLALSDTNIDAYPHTTASNTSSYMPLQAILNNFNNMKDELNIEIIYVTRSYFTRHGAGPFPTECSMNSINSDIVDNTNINNTFQDSIRYGYFDKIEFLDRINKDKDNAISLIYNCNNSNITLDFSLFVTHLNYTNDCFYELNKCYPIITLDKYFNHIYLSDSRLAQDIKQIK